MLLLRADLVAAAQKKGDSNNGLIGVDGFVALRASVVSSDQRTVTDPADAGFR
jgi:hypothetical protein